MISARVLLEITYPFWPARWSPERRCKLGPHLGLFFYASSSLSQTCAPIHCANVKPAPISSQPVTQAPNNHSIWPVPAGAYCVHRIGSPPRAVRYDRSAAGCGYTPTGNRDDHLSEGAIQSPLIGALFLCSVPGGASQAGMLSCYALRAGQKKRPHGGGPNGDLNSPSVQAKAWRTRTKYRRTTSTYT